MDNPLIYENLDNEEREDMLRSMGVACANLEDISIGGIRKVQILRDNVGNVMGLHWLEGKREPDIFAAKWTKDHHSQGSSDTNSTFTTLGQTM
jgi:hypothetical protein